MRPLRTLPFFSKRPMISPTCRGGGRRRGDGEGRGSGGATVGEMDKAHRRRARGTGRGAARGPYRSIVDRSRAGGVRVASRTHVSALDAVGLDHDVRALGLEAAGEDLNLPRADALAATAPRASRYAARGACGRRWRESTSPRARRAQPRERRSGARRRRAARRRARRRRRWRRTWSSVCAGECARRGVPRSGGRSDRAPSCGDGRRGRRVLIRQRRAPDPTRAACVGSLALRAAPRRHVRARPRPPRSPAPPAPSAAAPRAHRPPRARDPRGGGVPRLDARQGVRRDDPRDCALAVGAGASFNGMILWPKSSAGRVRRRRRDRRQGEGGRRRPRRRLQDESAEEIIAACDAVGIDYAQLHGTIANHHVRSPRLVQQKCSRARA